MLQTILLAEAETYIISFAELPAQLVFHALMVLVLFFVLGKLVFQPVLKMMQKRADTIQNNLNEAQEKKEQALELKAEYDKKLEGAAQEREEILAESYRTARKREEAIVQDARSEAERIRERARRDTAQEQAKAREELKKETVDLASAMTEKLLREHLTPEEKDKLLQQSMKEMEEAPWQKQK